MKLQMQINHETQLRQQEILFGNIERQINELSLQIAVIQEKLFDTIKINTENLKDLIRNESQPQVLADEKFLIITDIKEKLEQHEQLLNTIIGNQNDTRQSIKEMHMGDRTQTLKIDEKLKAFEDTSKPKINEMKFYQDIQQHLSKDSF